MATTPEGRVKNKVRALLEQAGVWFTPVVASGYSRAGIPDYVGCWRGRFLAIECKAGKGRTTKLQKREIASIKAAGGLALVINEKNIDELRTLLGLPAGKPHQQPDRYKLKTEETLP